jgi:hypothetical protein
MTTNKSDLETAIDQILHNTLDNLRGYVESAAEKDLTKLAIMARCTWEGEAAIGTTTRGEMLDVLRGLQAHVPGGQGASTALLEARVRDTNSDRIPLLIVFIQPEEDPPLVLQLCWCVYVPEGLSPGGSA